MSKANVVPFESAQPAIEKFKAKPLAEGEVYVESFFFDIESIKQLIEGVPVKSITGVRVHLSQVEREGGLAISPVVELVTKDNTLDKSQKKVSSDPPPCPTHC